MARAPLHRYEAIAGEIKSEILAGTYDETRKLPSERHLGLRFSAQRTTIRQSLALLESEGMIAAVGKRGWFVPLRETEGPKTKRAMLVTFRRPSGLAVESLSLGLQESLARAGIGLLRYDSPAEEEGKQIQTIEQLTTVDADGIVMWPHRSVDKRLLVNLRSSLPLVLVDRSVFGFECDSVLFDDLGGGRIVTEHLIANGHRRIAFLADEPFAESVQYRWQGYRLALETAGIVPDDNLSVFTFGRPEPTFSANVDVLLRRVPEPPTAIVCANDGIASLLLLILRERGIRVPQDVAVTGFGNHDPNTLDVMDLTSVQQPFDALGHEAGRLLLERLASPDRRGRPAQELLVPMSLAPRSSSAFGGFSKGASSVA